MTSKAATVDEYLAELPEDRREALQAIRRVVNSNLGSGFEEGMQYGMIGWFVPHSVYPAGYHCDPKQPLPFMGLASQKNHIGFYAFCIYTDSKVKDWFVDEFQKAGKRLDMGKSCIRFKKLEAIPLELLGQLTSKISVEKFIQSYEEARANNFR